MRLHDMPEEEGTAFTCTALMQVFTHVLNTVGYTPDPHWCEMSPLHFCW